MDIRCPLCQAPIELADGAADVLKSISSVDCPNCGLVPLHGDGSTVTFQPASEKQTIAHFQLVRVLGEGSFGTVWLANDRDLHRQVALKVALQEGSDVGTLLHEAQAAADLKHPNIVSVFEVGSENGRVYIASELIAGMNLRDLLSAGRPKTERAVELALTVANALQHAHEHGTVHRDIKPSNIMLDQDGEPYVADFGLAKRLAADASISAEGAILGTALYMSPEQADGRSKEIDGRTDVYALGVTLFEMLTGHVPFRGNVHAVLQQKLNEEAPSPRTLNPNLPRDLETICLKCLERDPEKRYQSARELADELERFQSGVPILARPITSIEKTWRWCRRNKLVAGLLFGLFATLATGLISVSIFWRQSVENERLANRRLYRSEMNVVSQYLYKGDINGVKRTLNRFESEAALSRLRDFAWHYHKTAIAPFLQVSNQGDPVIDVAAFPDGRFYAACGNNQQTRVWDAESGELVRTLTIENERFQSLAVSPANSHLATGSTDGLVRVWNPLKDNRPVMQMKHGPPVRLVRYSHDGKLLLSAAKKGLVHVWDVATGKSINRFPTGQSGNVDVRFSPDAGLIAVATNDGRIRLRDTKSGSIERVISPFPEANLNPRMKSMTFSDDGERIVTGSDDGIIRVWSTESGERLYEYHTQLARIGDLEFLSKHMLAVPTISGPLLIFDTRHRQTIRRLQTHNLTGGILDRSADRRVLVVGSGGGSVKLLDIAALREPMMYWHRRVENTGDESAGGSSRPGRRAGNPVRGIAFLRGGKQIVSAAAEGGIAVWKLGDVARRDIVVVGENQHLTAMAVDPKGKLVAAAIFKEERIEKRPRIVESQLMLWEIESGKLVSKANLGKSRVTACRFSPSGDTVATGQESGLVTIRKTDDWDTPLLEETPRESGVADLLYSPEGDHVAVAYREGVVAFYSTTSGEAAGESLIVPEVPLALAYCSGGTQLAVGTEVGTVQLFNLADGSLQKSIQAHASRVNVVAAFPGGRTIVTGGRDLELKLWDSASGESITTLYGHRRQFTSLAISPDGKTIASGALLGDVRIWRSRRE